jgi:hypothetical protein
MFPFMRGTKHSQVSEELMEEWAPIIDDGDLGLWYCVMYQKVCTAGMYLWMKPRAGQPGLISLVTAVDERSDLIDAQLFNSASDKRIDQWQQTVHPFLECIP